jgi:DNA-binding response OmpR family regulator
MLSRRPVLVLEDDPGVAATICSALARDGWDTQTAGTLADGRVCLQEVKPRIVVVDLGLPDGNGIAFVREAAASGDCGVIVISGRCDEVDRIVGLEIGADDYMTKPFSPREMVARVRALCRRLDAATPSAAGPAAATGPVVGVAEPSAWNIGSIRLEPRRLRLLAADGTVTRLTGGEAGMLGLLLGAPENLVDRETISDRVLGRHLLPEQRGVDQLASNLRQKLVAASGNKVTIAALRGKGYRLVW